MKQELSSQLQQELRDRLKYFETLVELLGDDAELSEDELEELRDLRALRREEKREARAIDKWKKAKMVWRYPVPIVDSADGYAYTLTYEDLLKVFNLDDRSIARLKRLWKPEDFARWNAQQTEVETWLKANAEQVARPESIDNLCVDSDDFCLYWFKESE